MNQGIVPESNCHTENAALINRGNPAGSAGLPGSHEPNSCQQLWIQPPYLIRARRRSQQSSVDAAGAIVELAQHADPMAGRLHEIPVVLREEQRRHPHRGHQKRS